MSDDEDYGFEYSDEEDLEDDEVTIENEYYAAKALRDDDPDAAIATFEKAADMEAEPGEWGFKAYKAIVKLQLKRQKLTQMLEAYKKMLTYIKSAVTRNYSEKVINKILDLVSTSQQMELLQELYETTLATLVEAKNERLWFKTNLKLGKLWFDRGEYARLTPILKELYRACQNDEGAEDLKKGTQLLEAYALEIQMHTAAKDNKRLKALYHKALRIKSAIPHPRIMGVIRECGGKMHMAQRQWELARNDFFEAFKNYDEAGVQRRIACLKYLVLANMLMNSDIDPFDSQEAKPYKNDPEVVAMTNLVSAYMRNEVRAFEKVLRTPAARSVMDDAFIKLYLDDVIKNLRTQVLLATVRPYTRIRIEYLAAELNMEALAVEDLLVSLILDKQIDGLIDQTNGVLNMTDRPAEHERCLALDKWTAKLSALQASVYNKLG